MDTGTTETKAQRMEGHPGYLNKVTFSDDFTHVQCEIHDSHTYTSYPCVIEVIVHSYMGYSAAFVCIHWLEFLEHAFPPNKSISHSNAVNMEKSRGVAKCCHCTSSFFQAFLVAAVGRFLLYQGTKFRVRNCVDSDENLAQYLY